MNSTFKIKNPNFTAIFKNMPKVQRPAFTTPAIKYKKIPKVVVHNDGHCHPVPPRTSLGIFLKTALKFGFFILNALFTSKTPKKELEVFKSQSQPKAPCSA